MTCVNKVVENQSYLTNQQNQQNQQDDQDDKVQSINLTVILPPITPLNNPSVSI